MGSNQLGKVNWRVMPNCDIDELHVKLECITVCLGILMLVFVYTTSVQIELAID